MGTLGSDTVRKYNTRFRFRKRAKGEMVALMLCKLCSNQKLL
jgi:hypothetical protein